MNHFFLLNEAIEVPLFEDFKTGMLELIYIDKDPTCDVFLRHESIYNLDIFNQLCSFMYSGQLELAIMKFIEQLSPCQDYLPSDNVIDAYFGTNQNAFLGINYQGIVGITLERQIVNSKSFTEWKNLQLTNFEKLINLFSNHRIHVDFKDAFEGLSNTIQLAIIECFKRSLSRGLQYPFQPDGSLIKDVSPDNRKTTVLELRVYSPVALRVYFHAEGDIVFLASIELKSNPNQNKDIKNAHDIIKNLKDQ